MSSEQSIIADNLASVLSKIENAARRAGRDPAEVRLVAVTKYAELNWVKHLIQAGIKTLGESRPQQLTERVPILGDSIELHLIGHLQRNKVRLILPHVSLIHSVDSLRLLRRIDEISAEMSLSPRVLLEVNTTGEKSKDGFSIDALTRDWDQILRCKSVKVSGLMTMARESDDPEEARSTFSSLRQLRDELSSRPTSPQLPELSMGMSGDYQVGIEEGATLVRIGSALFDGLQ